MSNNPFQIMQAMQNPQMLLQNMLQDQRIMNDPRARRASELLQSHDTKGLQDMARNLCGEYGTTPEQVGQMIRQRFNFM